MDYQITCICRHRFLVSQDKVKETVICPACQQRLSPVVDSPVEAGAALAAGATSGDPGLAALSPGPDSAAVAPAGDAVAAPADQTKRCPFCGEVILAVARKCKHCGEFLDRAAPAGQPGA